MMRRYLPFAALAGLLLIGSAAAQMCGGGNCVAPTPPPADNSDRIATSAFVTGAVSTVTSNLNASNLSSGTVPCARMPALTGDITSSSGSCATAFGSIAGLSVVGVTGASPGVPAAITSPGADRVFRTNAAGTTVSWGPVNLASTNAVTGTLPVANGGTGASSGSGTALDNISGFSSTGFISRTGAGSYFFTAGSGSGFVVLTTSPNITTPNIIGTSTNDNAAAGSVGEYVESIVATGSAVALTTGTQTNLTSISLTAGDWDVTADFNFNPGATTNITSLIGSISTSSATLDQVAGRVGYYQVAPSVPAGGTITVKVGGPRRLSLAGTTTVYAVAFANFTVSTNAVWGILRARRVR